MKFTLNGFIKIKTELLELNQGVKIYVIDNGKGIKHCDQDKLF